MTSPAPITDLDGCINAIVTHAVAAGTVVNPPITNIERGDPIPAGISGRVFWQGEVPPPGFGSSPNVLNGQLVGERIGIAIFVPISSSDATMAVNRDADLWAFWNALRAALQADSNLGGNCTDMDVQYATVDYLQITGTTYRVLMADVDLSYIEYPTSLG